MSQMADPLILVEQGLELGIVEFNRQKIFASFY